MTDAEKEWLERQADLARRQVPGAPAPEVGPIDPDTHTYPVHLPVPLGNGPRRLLTLIPDTWVERKQAKRIIAAIADALRHHLG